MPAGAVYVVVVPASAEELPVMVQDTVAFCDTLKDPVFAVQPLASVTDK